MKRLAAGAIGVGALGAAGLAYALAEAQWFALRAVTVPVLPAGSRPLTVLHLSDLHLLTRQRRKIAWIQNLARLKPDLVVTTGDNMAEPGALEAVFEALDPLTGTPAAFVFGGHDYFAPGLPHPSRYLHGTTAGGHADRLPDLPGDELAAGLRARGWHDLNNARARVTLDGREVALVGVSDPHEGWDEFPPSDESPRADLRMGVVHAPYQRVLRQFADDGARLVLAGHTHGGQLCLPVFGTLVTNCDIDRKRAKGLNLWPGVQRGAGPLGDPAEQARQLWLHVSAGLGTAPQTPVRFACRPEATMLTLVSA